MVATSAGGAAAPANIAAISDALSASSDTSGSADGVAAPANIAAISDALSASSDTSGSGLAGAGGTSAAGSSERAGGGLERAPEDGRDAASSSAISSTESVSESTSGARSIVIGIGRDASRLSAASGVPVDHLGVALPAPCDYARRHAEGDRAHAIGSEVALPQSVAAHSWVALQHSV